MIVDLGGVTTEPSRRRHVVILSVAAAAVSLVLLIALVVPAQRMESPPLTASAPPRPTDAAFVSWADFIARPSNPMWIQSDRGGPFEESMRDDIASGTVTLAECAPGIGSSPPVHLVLDGSGRVIAAYSSGRAGRFLPLPPGFGRSGWVTVPCDTSEVFAPRINRAR